MQQKVEFKESVKVLFLLITLPDSWDTFRTTISNSAPAGGLTERNVTGSLLTEEINRLNNEGSKAGNALTVRGRSSDKGKEKERSRSKSKTRRSVKDIECYHCGKKGHMKKNCRSFKKKNENDKTKLTLQPDNVPSLHLHHRLIRPRHFPLQHAPSPRGRSLSQKLAQCAAAYSTQNWHCSE